MKVREYFLSMKERLEEYNEMLKRQSDEKSKRIDALRAEGNSTKVEVTRLRAEKEILDKRINELSTALRRKEFKELVNEAFGKVLLSYQPEILGNGIESSDNA